MPVNVVESSAQQQRAIASAAFRHAEVLVGQGRQEEALAVCERLLADSVSEADMPLAVMCCKALRLQAHVLRQLERPADALGALDRLVADHGQRGEPEVREHIASALFQRTWLIDDPVARCVACDLMSEVLDRHDDKPLDAWRVEARLLKGEIEQHRGLPQDAMATLDALIERFDALHDDPAIVLRLARARLGNVANLRELGQHTQAQVLCLGVADQVEAEFGRAGPELRLEGVRALTMFFDGLGPTEQERRAELVEWLLDRYGRDTSTEVRQMAVVRAYDWAAGLREQDHGEAALAACERLLAVFIDDTDAVVQRTVASALLSKGHMLFEQLDRPDEALAVYEHLIARLRDTAAQSSEAPALHGTLAKASAGRLACLKRLKNAHTDFGSQFSALPGALRDEVRDTVKRARKHGDAGEPAEAIALFDAVLAEHGDSPHPELRKQCARSLIHKSYCLLLMERFEEVVHAADQMDARYGAEPSKEMQEKVALALQYKSTALDRLGRQDEEMQVHDLMVARWGDSDVAELRARVVGALFRKGVALRQASRLEAAVATYDEVIARVGTGGENALQLWAAKAMINKARALDKLGNPDGQAEVYRQLIARFGDSGDAALRERVANASEWLAETEGRRGNVESQRAALEDALGRFGTAMSSGQRARMARELSSLKARAIGRMARDGLKALLRR